MKGLMISQSLSEDTKLLFEPFEKGYRKYYCY